MLLAAICVAIPLSFGPNATPPDKKFTCMTWDNELGKERVQRCMRQNTGFTGACRLCQ